MTEKKRGFEITQAYQNKEIHLPIRATKGAAGYDFEAAEDTTIPSIWQAGFLKVLVALLKNKINDAETTSGNQFLKPILIPTGIKSYMQDDEYLQLANRSSNALKRLLVLPNGVGIIDNDYYNNPSNEGHIQFQLLNFGLRDVTIKKGERIGQGIFIPFLKADNDHTHDKTRDGGFGSSGTDSLKK